MGLSTLAVAAGRLQPVKILPGLPARTLCLTYHDVIPFRTVDSLWFDCSIDELRKQLDWMSAQGAHFVTVAQLYSHLTTGAPLPSHPVCITFADNYLGFYTYAYPVLRTRRIPCAMFVHTGYVGSPVGRPKMDWDQLRQLDREGLVTVESQTVTHPPDLRRMTYRAQLSEMRASRAMLEQRLGHPVVFIAYPNGKFNAASERAARASGYQMGFSEKLTPAERSPSIFAVSRYVHTRMRQGWRDANR
jgi:peptidoglycan/xylan/chitin deacetylase (PgdA/CDA1 family)